MKQVFSQRNVVMLCLATMFAAQAFAQRNVIINNGINDEVYTSHDTVFCDGLFPITIVNPNYHVEVYDQWSHTIFFSWAYRDESGYAYELSVWKHVLNGRWYYSYEAHYEGLILYKGDVNVANNFRIPELNIGKNVSPNRQ